MFLCVAAVLNIIHMGKRNRTREVSLISITIMR